MTTPTVPDQRSDLASRLLPYSPSPVDILAAWVDRLPGPGWAYYITLYGVLLIIDVIGRSAGSSLQLPSVFTLVFLTALPFDLFFIHYLDRYALSALERFRKGMPIDNSFDEVRYRLSTMPILPMLVNCLIGALIGVIFLGIIPYDFQLNLLSLTQNYPAMWFYQLMTILAFAAGSCVIYHTWHQLRVVNQLYQTHSDVDLFQQEPLYAFSDLSARTAIGLLFIGLGWTLSAPQLSGMSTVVVYFVALSVISGVTFVFPLLGIHRVLQQNKNVLLVQNLGLFQKATAVLHTQIESGQPTNMDNLNKAMQSLELERQLIERTPTWPWNPEAPRTVIAAILLPLILWAVQSVFQRIMPL